MTKDPTPERDEKHDLKTRHGRRALAMEAFIARAEREGLDFDELWAEVERVSGQAAERREVGVLTADELRRWWRATVLRAAAALASRRAKHLQERADAELRALYYDAGEARGMPLGKPILFDPVTGTLREGPLAPPRQGSGS